jgi:thiol-disulfide isomerase/thioredoxin
MGRLPAVKPKTPFSSACIAGAALCAVLLLDCNRSDKKPPTVTKERSQAVVTTGEPQPASPAAEPARSAAMESASTKPPRRLCDGNLNKAGRALPKLALSQAAAAGSAALPAALPVHDGVWTWLNFWAAWCVPCKEEIPRLKAWEAKLNASGKSFQVVFVTLDDDPRQLQDFLNGQPPGGLRATYWLKEGKEREDWLKSAELSSDPSLPMHLIVDGRGKARCTIDGAVEDRDFDQLTALIGR